MDYYRRVAEIYAPSYRRGGTGYLIQDDFILTAYHVIASPEKTITSTSKELYDIRFIGDFEDGRTKWLSEGASLCWFDLKHDLALLKLTGGRPIFLVENESGIRFGELGGESLLASGFGFPRVQQIEERRNP